MAVLEVHNSLVMVLGFFLCLFFFWLVGVILFGWLVFIRLMKSFVSPNGSKVCVCVPLSLSLLVRSVSRCNVWVLISVV